MSCWWCWGGGGLVLVHLQCQATPMFFFLRSSDQHCIVSFVLSSLATCVWMNVLCKLLTIFLFANLADFEVNCAQVRWQFQFIFVFVPFCICALWYMFPPICSILSWIVSRCPVSLTANVLTHVSSARRVTMCQSTKIEKEKFLLTM